MQPVGTWLTQPLLTSTRTMVSMRKTFITFEYSPVDKGLHRRRHLQPRRPLPQRQQQQAHLQPRQRQLRRRHQLPRRHPGLLLLRGVLQSQGLARLRIQGPWFHGDQWIMDHVEGTRWNRRRRRIVFLISRSHKKLSTSQPLAITKSASESIEIQ